MAVKEEVKVRVEEQDSLSPIIPAPGSPSQEYFEFEARLDYLMRLLGKKKTTQQTKQANNNNNNWKSILWLSSALWLKE